jgi:5-oxoprolinase (ATP-hydrolysing)
MHGCDSVAVGAGDLFVIETPGGGGYGTPETDGMPEAGPACQVTAAAPGDPD